MALGCAAYPGRTGGAGGLRGSNAAFGQTSDWIARRGIPLEAGAWREFSRVGSAGPCAGKNPLECGAQGLRLARIRPSAVPRAAAWQESTLVRCAMGAADGLAVAPPGVLRGGCLTRGPLGPEAAVFRPVGTALGRFLATPSGKYRTRAISCRRRAAPPRFRAPQRGLAPRILPGDVTPRRCGRG